MINIKEEKLLSDNWYHLKKYTFEYVKKDGSSEIQAREVYDRGNGATIFLYNPDEKKILLTKQFRLPTYLNGNQDGMLVETCAGVLDGDSPEECVRREAEEETGFSVSEVRKVFELYMSPGAVTEIIHFFFGRYHSSSRVGSGGGLASETENIEVIEMSYDDAKKMFSQGEIKDGKTMLLFQRAVLEKLI